MRRSSENVPVVGKKFA